jgi:hypothetical protein
METPQSTFVAPLDTVLDLLEYLQHDSWRCAYTGVCHCGLDALTDKLGIERVKMENTLQRPEIKR